MRRYVRLSDAAQAAATGTDYVAPLIPAGAALQVHSPPGAVTSQKQTLHHLLRQSVCTLSILWSGLLIWAALCCHAMPQYNRIQLKCAHLSLLCAAVTKWRHRRECLLLRRCGPASYPGRQLGGRRGGVPGAVALCEYQRSLVRLSHRCVTCRMCGVRMRKAAASTTPLITCYSALPGSGGCSPVNACPAGHLGVHSQ